jgi:hypothetical protein
MLFPKNGSLDILTGRIGETLTRIFPSREVDLEGEKKEVWKELSMIYFKYDDDTWRKAFREIMIYLFDQISESKWDEIYNKMYSEKKA